MIKKLVEATYTDTNRKTIEFSCGNANTAGDDTYLKIELDLTIPNRCCDSKVVYRE